MQNTILIVEDDKNINELISEYLKDSGFIVINTYDGITANNIINQNEKIDLFILDIMLPEISGLDLLKNIRINKIHKEKPIIMLTALKDEYTQLKSFDGLTDDYLTKPFSFKILVKRVEALLRRTGQSNNFVQIGKISLDIDNYEVYEDGKKILLTLREFEILKYLIANQNKVISRQQILDYIWGYSYFGDERIVDAHIKNVRKKIQSNIITTVKGIGYKIEPPSQDI